MNIRAKGNVLVLAKNSREGNNRQFYYDLAIMSDGEAGNISCTLDAYDKAEINTFNEVVFAYNERYKSFRVVDVIPPAYEPEAPADSKADKPDGKADTKPDNKPDKAPAAK